jgi:hypothetical protein
MKKNDPNSTMLPSFFVIGPPRTGTSWLHEVLKQHTSLPHHVKETRFFDEHFGRGMDWYLRYFSRNRSAPRGEVAPTYFASAEARERIARTVPEAKVVCIFRHPVQRATSLYRLKHAYGMIRTDFEEALFRDPELVESGKYATYLKAWRKALGPGRVLATFYEKLRDDPQQYVDELAEFIGIPRFKLSRAQRRFVHNSEALTQPRHFASTRFGLALANALKRQHFDRLVVALRASRLGKLLLSGGRPFTRVSPEASRAALELFRREVEELERMLNVDLSAWKSVEAGEAEARIEELVRSDNGRERIPSLRKAEIPDQAA